MTKAQHASPDDANFKLIAWVLSQSVSHVSVNNRSVEKRHE
jgi:hypothetical protein